MTPLQNYHAGGSFVSASLLQRPPRAKYSAEHRRVLAGGRDGLGSGWFNAFWRQPSQSKDLLRLFLRSSRKGPCANLLVPRFVTGSRLPCINFYVNMTTADAN